MNGEAFFRFTAISWGSPPFAETLKMLWPYQGPLVKISEEPSGDQDGKVPVSTIFLGLPPKVGITQIAPPINGWSVP